jgi:hypothetical protein
MNGELVYHCLQALGAGAAFFLAFRSFERRSIKLGEEPTLRATSRRAAGTGSA